MPTFDAKFASLGLFFSGTPYLDLEVDQLKEEAKKKKKRKKKKKEEAVIVLPQYGKY